MTSPVKLDSYYEWCIEKMRHELREAQGVGSDISILMAAFDSVLKQVDVEIVESPGCQYRALTEALRSQREGLAPKENR